MRLIAAHEANQLSSRLYALDPHIVIGFPNTDNNQAMRLSAWHGRPVERFLDLAYGGQNIESTRLSLPAANRPTGFENNITLNSWLDLPEASKDQRFRRMPVRPVEDPARFADNFGRLLRTSAARGWLLGFGWVPDSRPAGDFGEDPDVSEVYRILPPARGKTGYREAIGLSSNPETALADAIKRLGRAAVR